MEAVRMESPEAILMPVHRLMPILVCCVAGLVVIFVLMALVRLWGLRMQTKAGGCGGLDLDELRRQRDAGEISPEEYDAVYGSVAGNRPAPASALGKQSRADEAPEGPISGQGGADDAPERKDGHGQD
ncbi:MAG: SHOCT domain-containing protein [Planctomycetes bacterium]|nr:SHOCT domain-containing protein [Planctomycetota bacterium]